MSTETVFHLGVEFGYDFFSGALEISSEAKLIQAELNRHTASPLIFWV
jgi:hypothetical protein